MSCEESGELSLLQMDSFLLTLWDGNCYAVPKGHQDKREEAVERRRGMDCGWYNLMRILATKPARGGMGL